ncbi:hypothetical protein DZC30_10255 [Comamonas testosteroni]|uniref:TfoX N-terminal domain-containing protein n=1 Tax=Comamonas testosteroni TaxID=285 RepID=A0A373FMF1_COMTE|nr:TfoX/Sxy family protein [Comamonas testosteroni]RGE45323.1 hypothetical protein DZC30_10255 [Comamonas testosteroni]
MPARPLDPETLRLIDAVREALAENVAGLEIEEKRMFGCHVFMVDGKMCLGVENDELLVRLPPDSHTQVAETPGVRPLSPSGGMNGYFLIGPTAYSTRDAWNAWIAGALAFNPLAKATPKKSRKSKQADESDKNSQNNSSKPKSSKDIKPEKLVNPKKPGKASSRKTHPIFGSE